MRFSSKTVTAIKVCLIITLLMQQVAVSAVSFETRKSCRVLDNASASASEKLCSGCGCCEIRESDEFCSCCAHEQESETKQTSCCSSRDEEYGVSHSNAKLSPGKRSAQSSFAESLGGASRGCSCALNRAPTLPPEPPLSSRNISEQLGRKIDTTNSPVLPVHREGGSSSFVVLPSVTPRPSYAQLAFCVWQI